MEFITGLKQQEEAELEDLLKQRKEQRLFWKGQCTASVIWVKSHL